LSLTALDAEKLEGDTGTTDFTFTVTRSSSHGNVAVGYIVTGAQPEDFVDASVLTGIVMFRPGETSKVITIPIAGDTLAEDDETFTVTLSDPSNHRYVIAGSASATGTIQNDDHQRTVQLVSVSSTGEQGGSSSYNPSISADGRYVSFTSDSMNLVPEDTNQVSDIFVHDGATGTTERVSLSSTGEQANGFSDASSISADGRYVAYWSDASNLVPGDTNGIVDVFVYDRTTGTTELVSVSSTGEQGNSGGSEPSISGDGRYVAFTSLSSNLVPDDTNGAMDVFVRDRTTGTTERVSVSSSGEQAEIGGDSPWISADGRYVVYQSLSTNLVAGDTNGSWDVFVYDRVTGTNERISVSSTGEQGDGGSLSPSISGDGRYVAYRSYASNLVPSDTNATADVFVYDRAIGSTELVSVSSTGEQANATGSEPPLISADGRHVTYESWASNLVPGDTNGFIDIFVHDRVLGTTERVSVSSAGEQGNYHSVNPSMSADGNYVAYTAIGSNLVPGDANGVADVLVISTQEFLLA
jgi:Tol biopolymer transport system component